MLNYKMARAKAAEIKVVQQHEMRKGRRRVFMTKLTDGSVGWGPTMQISQNHAEIRAAKQLMRNFNSGRIVIIPHEVLDRVEEKLKQLPKRTTPVRLSHKKHQNA